MSVGARRRRGPAMIAPAGGDHRGPYDVGGMRLVTIICRREVAHARVLANSAAEHAPALSVTALVLDATLEDRGSPEPFELLRPEDLAIEEIGTLAVMLELDELREACKPRLLRHMLAVAPGEALLYLDADSLICGPLEDVARLASEHGVLVTPSHRARPAAGRAPSQRGGSARVGDARQRAARTRGRAATMLSSWTGGPPAGRSARCWTGRRPRSTASRCLARARSS